MRVAIVGCGTIGRSWAARFAAAGHEVALFDADAQTARDAISCVIPMLAQLHDHGLSPAPEQALRSIAVHATLQDAVAGVEFVQESVAEKEDVKRAVFEALDLAAPPNAILASSASAIPGSKFISHLEKRERCIIAHPANPPHLLPLVELVPSLFTSIETIDRCRAFLQQAGMIPVVLNHEVPGFVMNRLQAAVVNEALSLVGEGVISPEGIDNVMRYSLGLRWAIMGPFETMELNAPLGFGDYARKFGDSYQALGRTLKVADPWSEKAIKDIESMRRAKLPLSSITGRQEWRDDLLARIQALIAENKTWLAGTADE